MSVSPVPLAQATAPAPAVPPAQTLAEFGWIAGLLALTLAVIVRLRGSARKVAKPFAAPIELTFTGTRMSITLAEAVLHYRLDIANISPRRIGPLAVTGTLSGASSDDTAPLDALSSGKPRRLPAIAPGGSATLAGTLRLALADLPPLGVGGARLLVPVVQWRVTGRTRRAAIATAQFLIGETDGSGLTLTPFRLDPGTVASAQLAVRKIG